MKKLLIAISLMLMAFTSSAQASDTVWQLQASNEDGQWVGMRYYTFKRLCIDDLVNAANKTGKDISRFRCSEVVVN